MLQYNHTLNFDAETFSLINLTAHGLYRYVWHPSFELLILCYSLDGAPVETIDLAAGEKIPDWLVDMILDPDVKKKAWNAAFERNALGRYLGLNLSPIAWEDTAVKAAMLGYPGSLDATAQAVGTDMKKAKIGKSLIRIFSIVHKATAAEKRQFQNFDKMDEILGIEHGLRRLIDIDGVTYFRTYWCDEPEKWEQYKDYCAQDVYTEQEISNKLNFFEIPKVEQELYQLDQLINDRGILADPTLIKNAIEHSKIYTSGLMQEAKDITGLSNPNSVKQLTEWLQIEIDEKIPTLKKDAVHSLLKNIANGDAKRVLQIRQSISKTSIKKYDALLRMLGDDLRAKGMFKFLGAGRTWRWSGQIFQPQNLFKNDLEDLDVLREMEIDGQWDSINMLWDTSNALAQLIRTSLIAPKGKKLCMSDFSSIEARVLAWLAIEMWKLEVFKGDGKIYEATAVRMFNIPIDLVTKSSKYRQRAKIMELLCGYQGGLNAVLRDPKNREIGTDEEIEALVNQWREANPRIVTFWKEVNNVAIEVVRTGEPRTLRNLSFYMSNNVFHIGLPSGRSLSYLKPVVREMLITPKSKMVDGKLIVQAPFRRNCLFYSGIDQETKRWKQIITYGGKLVENIVQAVSRDILAYKMLDLHKSGYDIVGHVHDEAIMEIGETVNIEPISAIMKKPLSWTKGLPLNADTYTSPFYRKD